MCVCLRQVNVRGPQKKLTNRGTDWRDGGKRLRRERTGRKTFFPGWSPSRVSEHDVRSCLATVIRSLYSPGALFYFMYSWGSYTPWLIEARVALQRGLSYIWYWFLTKLREPGLADPGAHTNNLDLTSNSRSNAGWRMVIVLCYVTVLYGQFCIWSGQQVSTTNT